MTEQPKQKQSPEYVDAIFVGREFKQQQKPGSAKNWQLFACKFGVNNEILKMTAFANPKKGLCIKSLIEGDVYHIGYTSEEVTFTNNQQEEITYDRRTVTFIREVKDEPKTPEQPTENATPVEQPKEEPVQTDLLNNPDQTAVNTGEFKPTSEESNLLDKLYKVPPDQVNETAFKDTLRGRITAIEPIRVDKLWLLYCKNMK